MWRAPRPTAHRGPPPACLQFCTSTTGSSHRWVRTNGANDGAQGMKESLGCHAADSALLTCPAPSAVEVHHSAVGWWGTMRGAGWWWGATTDNAYASWTGSGHLRGLCMQPSAWQRWRTEAGDGWPWGAGERVAAVPFWPLQPVPSPRVGAPSATAASKGWGRARGWLWRRPCTRCDGRLPRRGVGV